MKIFVQVMGFFIFNFISFLPKVHHLRTLVISISSLIFLSACSLSVDISDNNPSTHPSSQNPHGSPGKAQMTVATLNNGTLLVNLNNQSSVSVSGTCNPDNGVITSSIPFAATVKCEGGQWVGLIDMNLLPDGSGSLTLTLTVNSHQGGSLQNTSTNVPYVKLSSAPAIAILSPNDGTIISAATATHFEMNGTCSPVGATIELNIDGSFNQSLSCQSGNLWNTSLNWTGFSEGAHTVSLITRDSAGNQSPVATRSYTLNTTVPYILWVSATNSNGVYTTGTTLNIQVKTSAPITVNTSGGTPRMELNLFPQLKYANYSSGSGSDTLTFTATVQYGEGITLLNYASPLALSANGGVLTDATNNPLTLNLPLLSSGNDLGSRKLIGIDTLPPYAEVISGLPTGTNLVNALNLGVGASDVHEYRYAVGLDGSIDCSLDATYGAWTPQTTAIATSIAAQGAGLSKLCLLGRDLAGNEQSPTKATVYTWTRDLTPPSGLSYHLNHAVYTVGVTIPANVPSLTGTKPFTFSVSPALPAGLSLDTQTGVISGTPSQVTASADYTITATNTLGLNTTTDLTIEVLAGGSFTLTSVSDAESLAGFQVFSGACATGKTVMIELPANTSIPEGGSTTQVCANGNYAFGVSLSGEPGPRVFTLKQETETIQRKVSYNPSGLAQIQYGTNGGVSAMAYDPANQKIYIGGGFTVVQNQRQPYVARLNSDGSLDTNFATTGTGLNSHINTLAFDSANQKLYVGGDFTTYNGITTNRIARLNNDGSLDTSFAPTGTGLNATVYSLTYDSTNQKIYVGGQFTNYNGTTRNRIARLNSNGSLDTGFAPVGTGLNGLVTALAYDNTNEKLYVGGDFTTYNGTSRNSIARLNNNGSLDTSFVPGVTGFNNWVITLLYDSTQQKIYAGGMFHTFNGTARRYIARLNSDGSLDNSFNPPGEELDLMSITFAYDSTQQKLYVGGLSSFLTSLPFKNVARLNNDGSLDTSFAPTGYGLNGTVSALVYDDTSEQIYLGGSFTSYNGHSRNGIVRLNTDGGLDPTFAPSESGADSTVTTIADALTHQKIYIGGQFTRYNGSNRRYIAGLNSDGTLDTTFAPVGTGLNGNVNTAVYDSTNQKIYVGGQFTNYNGTTRNRIARLNSDGTLDTTFVPVGTGLNGNVNTAVYDSTNQKIYVGGWFTNYNGTTRNRIARLNNDGTLDTTFASAGTGLNNVVNTAIYDSTNQKIYVGGQFTNYNGTPRNRIARLNSGGTLDTSFAPAGTGLNNHVYAMVYDSASQKIYVGGTFTSYNGTPRNYIARLNSDGTLDTSFAPSGTGLNNTVNAIAYDPTLQKIYVGGAFTSYNGTTVNRVARLNSDGSLDTSFAPSGAGLNNVVNTLVYNPAHQRIFVSGVFQSYYATIANYMVWLKADGSLYNTGLNLQAPSLSMLNGTSKTLTTTGGTPPYTYSVAMGGGTINASSGVFTAPATPSQSTIQVSDQSRPPLTAQITLNSYSSALAVTPSPAYVRRGETLTLGAYGGIAAYDFHLLAGLGSISSSGLFTAPSESDVSIVRVTDQMNSSIQAQIYTLAPVQILPSQLQMTGGMSATLTAQGGHGPYSYRLLSGGGSVGSTTGVYVAPLAGGRATVAVEDALGDRAIAVIDVVGVTQPLTIAPTAINLAVNSTYLFTAQGGSGTYTFSKTSGNGSITNEGLFTAPATTGTTSIEVSDGTTTAQSTITITGALSISPTSTVGSVGMTNTFTVSGGVPPFKYEVLHGLGSIDTNGVFTPTQAGLATIKVSDSQGTAVLASVQVKESLQLQASAPMVPRSGSLTLQALNGVSPYVYSIESGGGSLNITGSTSGSVIYSAPANTGSVTLKVTDSRGQSNTLSVDVTAIRPYILYPAHPNVVYTGTSITAMSPLVIMGDMPTSYSINNGCLPTGLSFNTLTGAVTGTPTDSGSVANCVVMASNSGGATTTELQLFVRPPTAFTIDSPGDMATITGYQVFSGKCTTGYPITISSNEGFSIATASNNLISCHDDRYDVGINFWEPVNTTRTLTFQQGNQILTKTVFFNPTGFAVLQDGPNGSVSASVLDPVSGKVYIGGAFTAVRGKPMKGIARLNSDGSLDTSFNPIGTGLNGNVSAIAYDSANHKIYVGGEFTSYNATTRNYIARLNHDGSLDTTFAPTGTGFSGYVLTLAYDSANQKIYVGGIFTNYNGINQKHVARLNIDGSLDTSFAPSGTGLNNGVTTLLYDGTNEKIYIGGNFTNYNGTIRNYIARLNYDGTLDTTFAPTGTGFNTSVNTLALDSDNQKIYVGGWFTNYNGINQKHVARLNIDGSLDTDFSQIGDGFNQTAYAIAYDSANQKIYVGGIFTNYNGTTTNRIARLNHDGSLDTNFATSSTGLNYFCYSLIYDSSLQKIYVGGQFTSYNGSTRNSILRLNTDGNLDSSFASNVTGLNENVSAIAYDSTNQKIYVGGWFTSYNGTPRNYIARLNSDDTLDTSFAPVGTGLNNIVNTVAYDSTNQKLYVGGSFTNYNGTTTNRIARLNNDGTLDTTFAPAGTGLNGIVDTVVYDSSSQKVYVGGQFTNYNGTTRNRIARLNNNGSLDTSFAPTGTGLSGIVFAIAYDSTNQKLYVGGSFNSYDVTPRNRIARLNYDGSLDTAFAPVGTGLNWLVNTLTYDSTSQKIYIGGQFTTYNEIPRNSIARLNSDGTLDTSFAPSGIGFNGSVLAITYDSAHLKIYAGGNFTQYNHSTQHRFSTISVDGSLSP